VITKPQREPETGRANIQKFVAICLLALGDDASNSIVKYLDGFPIQQNAVVFFQHGL